MTQYILVYDNQVAGNTDDPNMGMPNGFTLWHYEGNEALHQLYFTGSGVAKIPPKPSGDYHWDINQWKPYTPMPTFTPPPAPTTPPPAVYSSTLFAEARALVEKESPLLASLMMWVYGESLQDQTIVDAAKAKVDTLVKQAKSVTSVTSVSNVSTVSTSTSTAISKPAATTTLRKP